MIDDDAYPANVVYKVTHQNGTMTVDYDDKTFIRYQSVATKMVLTYTDHVGKQWQTCTIELWVPEDKL